MSLRKAISVSLVLELSIHRSLITYRDASGHGSHAIGGASPRSTYDVVNAIARVAHRRGSRRYLVRNLSFYIMHVRVLLSSSSSFLRL
jgi:hypothetical protein